MAKFLTTHGTAYHIEQLISGSKRQLVLVSPYLQLSKTFIERLCDAENRGVKIHIIYGKDELKSNEKQSLSRMPNLNLYYSHNLHAKCYLNESEMVITSMNMYEFSEKNNREMGVLISRKDDLDVYNDAVIEIQSIIKSSEPRELFKNKIERREEYHQNNPAVKSVQNTSGVCIRCSTDIPLNPEKPYCYSCYEIWSCYNNPDYREYACHSCGNDEPTSMFYPLCLDCFKGKPKKTKTRYRSM
ncbi:hypothetical protein G3O08_17805 [Cryomorpha ignava]|uniref:Phospholipase D-like domain-containing protein n=1 Tax=Cryomorpha ignava TaxID=101383 RepID=A0A7K3WV25_9FLAO|nr:phospholipase D family protein [Cryomorpha ignava]NEN25354.1 hypothetical protein [Cryomorpha ignava]